VIHEVKELRDGAVPYFRAVQGPDGYWWWAECPRCGKVVKDKDGYGPSRHWDRMRKLEAK
jgi:uncharacterized C2H2 Zn-finger protein